MIGDRWSRWVGVLVVLGGLILLALFGITFNNGHSNAYLVPLGVVAIQVGLQIRNHELRLRVERLESQLELIWTREPSKDRGAKA